MENIRDDDIEDITWHLCYACSYGDIEEVEDILSNKEVDINGGYTGYAPLLGGYGYRGVTPLVHAVLRGHLAIVSRLLQHPGIILGVEDNNGDTALHKACLKNDVSIVKLLCQDSRCSPGVVKGELHSKMTLKGMKEDLKTNISSFLFF